jgi:hypothetical protein
MTGKKPRLSRIGALPHAKSRRVVFIGIGRLILLHSEGVCAIRAGQS